ncbi:hypothetical protein C7S17_2952 [Burkholderia thailandensis]|nr:hypothetical protein [Burkholderia thailandensis]
MNAASGDATSHTPPPGQPVDRRERRISPFASGDGVPGRRRDRCGG